MMLSNIKNLVPQYLRFGKCIYRQPSSSYFSLSHLSSSHQTTNEIHNTTGLHQAKNSFQHKAVVIPKLYYCDISPMKKEKVSANCDAEVKPTTYTEKLKQAIAHYGSTVIVFHITISLMSLGACYMLVASGLDLSEVLHKIGISEKFHKMASSSGTFAAAYLIHKIFAPVRISITLACTPFIVRYLRKAGFIKKALPKVENKK